MKLVAVLAVLLVVAYAQDAPSPPQLCAANEFLIVLVSNLRSDSNFRGEVMVQVGNLMPDSLPAPPQRRGLAVLVYLNVLVGTELKIQMFPDPLKPNIEVACSITLDNEFGKRMKCLDDNKNYVTYAYLCRDRIDAF